MSDLDDVMADLSVKTATSRRGVFGAFALAAAATQVTIPAFAAPAAKGGMSAGAIDAAVNQAFNRYRTLNDGANADYIPALAKVPSKFFGVSLVTGDGKVHEAGDTTEVFSIQSISKVFNAAIVMEQSGTDFFLTNVGVDATGKVFNSIEAIEQYRGKEMNPLVNAGAIATVGNIIGRSAEEVWDTIITFYSDMAGRALEVNQEVYKSEADTNQRNQAIGKLMSAYGLFPMDPGVATDLYTKACSVNVSSHDLGNMAATLAFGGRNPVTGKQVMNRKNVPGLLAVMATAGLYDDSGKWLFNTGLPGKSGVGGGLIAVAPGKFGIGTFSTKLDAAGNSIRGQRAITDINNTLGTNPLAQFG
jgi:glutaminase